MHPRSLSTPSWYLPITQAQAREKQQLRRASAADMLCFATSLQINMCKNGYR